MTNEKVSKLAVSSRIIVLLVQLTANILIPDHNPDVFKSPKISSKSTYALDKAFSLIFGGLRRWDAEYFLHIAEHGYTYENNLAFYPLYPYIINILTKFTRALTFDSSSFSEMSLFIGVMVNIYFFTRAANALYDLTIKLFSDANKSWMVVVLFCFNPASIFFSAPYSESLYCWLSLSLMNCCVNNLPFFKTTIFLGMSMLCRSNGLTNIGYVLFFSIRKIILKKTYLEIPRTIIILLMSVIPLSVFNFYMFKSFCLQKSEIEHSDIIVEYAKAKNYVLAGSRLPNNSPWCDQNIPLPYSYVQNFYWDVGFLNYYKLKQIPNFLLASPILIFLLVHIVKSMKIFFDFFCLNSFYNVLKDWKIFPFLVHCLFLTIFCLFFVHIQVSNRLLSSSNPCLFWFAADCLPRSFENFNFKKKYALIVYWFGSYFLLGIILFCNFYPWT